MEFHGLIINIHGFVSTLFTLTALTVLVLSVRGWSLKKPYTNWDKKIAILFLVLLYIQLVLGILLYFVLGHSPKGAESIEAAMEQTSFRYWALEHFIIMIFALFLSQIGWVFIRKSKLDSNKHKNTVFYFGISILLIIISTGVGLIWR
jgi:bacteriorhodopsin